MSKVQAAKGQQDLLETLLKDESSDEKTGANATRGFTYQQWWGALQVAELLASNVADFAIGMEVKEDVAVLDSATVPTSVEFCQVKKNEQTGGWKLKQLYALGRKRADGSKDMSPLAKLYRRRQQFAGHPTKLRFVSNVAVEVDGGTSGDRNLSDLTEQERNELRKSIAAQLEISDPADVDLDGFMLHRTSLPLTDQHSLVAGKLAELSEKNIIPFQIRFPNVVARLLASELQSKAADNSFAANFGELKARILSRSDALSIISSAEAAAKAPASELLDAAIQRLDAEGFDFKEVHAIRQARVTVLTHAVDRRNEQFFQLAQAIKSVAATNGAFVQLGSALASTVMAARSNHCDAFIGLYNGYVLATTLLVLYDAIEVDVLHVAFSSQSEDGK